MPVINYWALYHRNIHIKTAFVTRGRENLNRFDAAKCTNVTSLCAVYSFLIYIAQFSKPNTLYIGGRGMSILKTAVRIFV